MSYTSWKQRRQILKDADLGVQGKVVALALNDYIDWNTGRREFDSAQHIQNWYAWLAKEIGVGKTSFDAAMETICELGYAEYDVDGDCYLALVLSMREGDEDEGN